MGQTNLYIKIALFIFLITGTMTFIVTKDMQLNEMYINAHNIQSELENNIQNGINAVEYLNESASQIIQNKESIKFRYTPKLKSYNNNGNYTGDDMFGPQTPYVDKANISGYGKLAKDKNSLAEMEMSLELIRYFKRIKMQNKDYAWVYYYSNSDFITLYPFVTSKEMELLPEYKQQPLFIYATPALNPERKLFFTPLYIDNGGLGLMITIGKPVYDGNKFIGVTEIDMTLQSQSRMLAKLDYLNNNSIIVNQEGEVIGVNNVAKPNTKNVVMIDKLLEKGFSQLKDTNNGLTFYNGNYVYIKKFKNAPWKLIYYKSAYGIYLMSFFYMLPLFALMAFLYYLNKLYTRSEKLQIQLKEQANIDYMTGVHNRRYFFELGNMVFLKNERKNKPIAMAMLDIDFFKQINDTYGHDKGDAVIKNLCSILGANLRESDLMARFGGEEFCVLLDDITLDNATHLFEKIRRRIEANIIDIDESKIQYTVSIGIAYGIGKSLDDMIKRSDEALYTSKREGRNRITVLQQANF